MLGGDSHRVCLARDYLFLITVVFLSTVLYTHRLGFYYDDWSLLGHLRTSEDQSFLGLLRTILTFFPNVVDRPIQAIHLALMFRWFGEAPLFYHVTNGVVFTSGIVMFSVALQTLGLPRIAVVAVPLTYGLLPNYGTNRFWVAACSANLAMLAYFAALYSQTKALKRVRPWFWQGAAFAMTAIMVLTYEHFLPLLVLNPLIAWYVGRRTRAIEAIRFPWGVAVAHGALIVTLLAFKVLTTKRLEVEPNLMQHLYTTYWMFSELAKTNFVEYGFGMPSAAWRIQRAYPLPMVLALGAATGVLMLAYIYHLCQRDDIRWMTIGNMLRLTMLGVLVFLAGYAVFLFNYELSITATGVGNRTAIAGSVGVAIILVAAAGALSALWRQRAARNLSFAAWIAGLSVAGFVLNNTLAEFWDEAYRKQGTIMAGLREQYPTMPPDATVILDGFCPYAGPATVFTIDWDVTGALMVLYNRRDIKGDVVLPYTTVGTEVLHINNDYPYSRLYLYNHAHRISVELRDAESARQYFEKYNPDYTNGCPPFTWGRGVSIF